MNPCNDKTLLLRRLCPKSYHFDGYDVVNHHPFFPRPFFSTHKVEEMTTKDYTLSVDYHEDIDSIELKFESVCHKSVITFEPYYLRFEEFAEKIKNAVEKSCDLIEFKIKTKYEGYCMASCCNENPYCTSILKTKPDYMMAAVSFDFNDMKEAIPEYLEEKNTTTTNISGGTTMTTTNTTLKTNKLFGLNFEYGPSRDNNIASTLFGVAVRNPANGHWYTFENGTRKDYNTIKVGNLPLLLLPVKEPVVGDLLKIDGAYYYVREIKADTITLIGATDGIVREMVPEESLIPGMKFYTKVVALVNAKTGLIDTANNDVSGNMLAAMCMMNWAKGGDKATFSMDNINDESFNGLGSYLPLMLASGNGGALGNIFGGMDGNTALTMLMAMNGENDNDEFAQMMVLSQLMGNNKVANPIANLINPVAETATVEEVVCTGCGETYTDSNIKFCPACGKPTRPKANTCPGCNAVLKNGASFCHNCGMEIGKATYCKKCGKELSADENFCSACGTPAHAPAIVTCKNCGKELGTDEKFCSACGTSATSKPATPKKPAGKGKPKASKSTPAVTPPAEPEETEEATTEAGK